MKYEWHAGKAAANLAKHGAAFDLVEAFDWETALIIADMRREYGETRFTALGLIGKRLHTLTYTQRGAHIRVISLRKCNVRERKAYEESQTA